MGCGKPKNLRHKNMDQENKNNKGTDLSGSFKDSDNDIKFNEYKAPRSFYPRMPKIIQWVIKYSGGLVKNEKQANYVLLGFVVLAIIVSLFLFFGGRNKSSQLSAEQLEQMNNLMFVNK